MENNESPEQRIGRWNMEVAAFQRAGNIKEGVELADKAFFAALLELPEGHFLRAQGARNRGIMQFMAGDEKEAVKTLVAASHLYQQTLKACIARQQELERAGDLRGAQKAAEQRLEMSRNIEELRKMLSGSAANG
jgi:hypothetical protein